MDTGASHCVCDNKYSEAFTKKAIDNSNNFIAKDLIVFGIKYSDMNMVHLDMTKMSDGGAIVGIIGYPCVKNSILTLDCINKLLYYAE